MSNRIQVKFFKQYLEQWQQNIFRKRFLHYLLEENEKNCLNFLTVYSKKVLIKNWWLFYFIHLFHLPFGCRSTAALRSGVQVSVTVQSSTMKSESVQKHFPLFHPRLTKDTETRIGVRQSQLTFVCCKVLSQCVSAHTKSLPQADKVPHKGRYLHPINYCSLSL